jgi:hypothetical protein
VFRSEERHLAPAIGWFQEERQQMFSITCADFGDIDIVESIKGFKGFGNRRWRGTEGHSVEAEPH